MARGCLYEADNLEESLFATAGWSGTCKLWGIPDCAIRTELRGHKDRVGCIRFHPYVGHIPENGPNIATASADKTVRIWSMNPEYDFQKSVELKGHEDFVNWVEFHPMGKHIASGSSDKTWRLWDI